MEELIITLIEELSSVPPTTMVLAVSTIGIVGMWLVKKYLDHNAGIY